MWNRKELLRKWLLTSVYMKPLMCGVKFIGALFVGLFTYGLTASSAWAVACSGTSCTSMYINWAVSSTIYDTYIIINNLSATGPNSVREAYTCDICYWNSSNNLTFYREITVPDGASGTPAYSLDLYSSMNPNGYGPLLVDCTSGANVAGYINFSNTTTHVVNSYILSTSSESGGYCAALA